MVDLPLLSYTPERFWLGVSPGEPEEPTTGFLPETPAQKRNKQKKVDIFYEHLIKKGEKKSQHAGFLPIKSDILQAGADS